MATFMMLGKYSQESAKAISSKRTDKAQDLIKQLGGEIKAIYALLGDHDLAIIARFAAVPDAMKASLALSKSFGISFCTYPAVAVEEFDRMAAEL